MEIEQTVGPLRFIRGEKGGKYPYCNSVFIPEAGVLIDPGSDRKQLAQANERGVRAIWLSHWHEDHITHLDLFDGVPLYLHQADTAPLKDIITYISWYGIDPHSNPMQMDHWQHLLTDFFHFKPRTATDYLVDRQIIDLGCVTAEVIHAPGHSPGNLAFFFREPEILFLGDNDLTAFGPWYGDRYSDIDQIIRSIEKLRKVPARLWLTGHEHGIFQNVTAPTWDNYLAVIDRREARLLDLLKEPKTLEEIGQAWIVYGKPRKPVADFEMMECIHMKKHAERLMAKGQVELENGYYSLVP